MAFTLPTWAFTFHVWWSYDPAVSAYAAPDVLSVSGNLTPGRRVTLWYPAQFGQPIYDYSTMLLCPTGTQIGAFTDTRLNDVVELPKASGIFYSVYYVDYIGKGFANEHLMVVLHRFASAIVFTDITIPAPDFLP